MTQESLNKFVSNFVCVRTTGKFVAWFCHSKLSWLNKIRKAKFRFQEKFKLVYLLLYTNFKKLGVKSDKGFASYDRKYKQTNT